MVDLDWRGDAPTDDVRRMVEDEALVTRDASTGRRPLPDDSVRYHEALILDALAALEPMSLPAVYARPNAPITDDAVNAVFVLVELGDVEYARSGSTVLFRLANGRRDAESLLRAGYADEQAVKTLTAMGHRPHAEKLWKATKEKSMSENKEEQNGTPDAPKRRGRQKGSKNAAKASQSPTVRRDWDLVLSKGKTARLEIPSELSAEDLEAMKLQIDAIHKLLEVQEGIRAEAG